MLSKRSLDVSINGDKLAWVSPGVRPDVMKRQPQGLEGQSAL